MATLPIDLSETYIPEKTTQKLTFVVQDENEAAVGSGDITTLTVTLYDEATGTVINSRTDTDILNANGGTLDASGNGTWTMDPADNPIINGKAYEAHIALFEWTFGIAGAKAGRQTVRLMVVDLAKVT